MGRLLGRRSSAYVTLRPEIYAQATPVHITDLNYLHFMVVSYAHKISNFRDGMQHTLMSRKNVKAGDEENSPALSKVRLRHAMRMASLTPPNNHLEESSR